MEPSAGYPESPMEPDDVLYPCKGCGEILEEGKAFELAGNRWHIDCFRCNTCSTILDSDANLLLLGDGSLICNNCTYSCSVCNDKIEDLAILTGDQAFCANCFKCRNCKRKIENLKYARTSQGIFCMECHEHLMQRRRKKSQRNASSRHKTPPQPSNNSAMLLDKSLPSLPPSAVDRSAAWAPETDSPISEQYPETPADAPVPQRSRPSNSRSRSDHGTPEISRSQKRPQYLRSKSSTSEKRNRANSQDEDRKGMLLPASRSHSKHPDLSENLAPPSLQPNERNSTYSDSSRNGEDFFIPMKLDPNTAPGPSPIARRENNEAVRSPLQPESKSAKEHTNGKNGAVRSRNSEQEPSQRFPTEDSANGSRHSSQPNSPHIANQYQDRGRQVSSDVAADSGRKKFQNANNHIINSLAKDPVREASAGESKPRRNGDSQHNGRFMLQEVPKSKKSEKRNSKSDGQSQMTDPWGKVVQVGEASDKANSQVKEQQITLPPTESPDLSRSDTTLSGSPIETHNSRAHAPNDPHPTTSKTTLKNVPERGDSLAKSAQHPPPRRNGEIGSSSKLSSSVTATEDPYEKAASAPATTTTQPMGYSLHQKDHSKASDSPPRGHFTENLPHPPLRAKERLVVQQEDSSSDSFTAPRNPPHPPPSRNKNELSSLRNSDHVPSPGLPRFAEKEDASVDEETSRTPGPESQQEQGGFLRRVSHSVRHARSYSDRGIRQSKEHKWGVPKSPMIGSNSPSFAHEFSSPIASSPESKREDVERLKRELEMEKQKSAELEAALDAKSNIKKMNSELKEKRSTMVVLDTQKEIVVRELEVLTDHIAAAKRSREPLDVPKLGNDVLQEFAENLRSLRESFQPQIEELIQRRNDLSEEVSRFDQRKDKSMQEFEQLTVKNAQLADLNNQLVHQIQELYKASAGPALDVSQPPPIGLGVYNAHASRDKVPLSSSAREQRPSITESNLTGSTAVPDQDIDSTAYLAAPQVVNIRKAQPPKKFNWKKGGQNVAKGVKGLKGAFSSDGNRGQREGQLGTEGMPYGSMSQQETPRTDSYSKTPGQDRGPGFGGFFGAPKGRPQQWKNSPNSSYPASNSDGPPPLFGSELEVRAEFEHSNIPGVVMRCIQEVEARGMDIEGIYRKSGGTGQVQVIKEGFERSNDYDISDPDLDINAVTSTLKQYFRKLPTPLITYEVYNKMLEHATLQQNPDIDPSHPAHPNNPNNHAFRVRNMSYAVGDLPPHHRDTLEVLVFHLARVIEQAAENLMTPQNVAVVFAPTIMRPESLTREMVDTPLKNSAVQFLIENCQEVFLAGRNSGDGRTEKSA